MSTAVNEMYNKVVEIAQNAVQLDRDGKYMPDLIQSAFKVIETLEPRGMDGVMAAIRNRNSAVEILLLESGEPAFKYFKYALDKGDRDTQSYTVRILQKIGKPAWPMLKDFIWSDSDESTRCEAARVFAFGGDEGLGILTNIFEDNNPNPDKPELNRV